MYKKILILGVFLAAGVLILVFTAKDNTNKSSTVSPTASPSITPKSQDTSSGHTLLDVASHNGRPSCWSVVNGKIYDLTSWIDKHPGGSDRILKICGTDGSANFNNQHGGKQKPADQLVNFYVGDLSVR
ncbi:MAG: hypothetical protein UW46_C0006G0028 [Candidatus Yanofskybacteria bacterium GW2011_GWF1_44_227]|uniref:Cytochrome b5 heme-binding domain-containing protein n=1 Tax=Candidatus Yanofskybacteria bacterium GW2011_GWE2_40_11 TaxID=1619033 RepID=A0A0G0TT18_9BACT|nr:MAG: hypothetical protein UT69_C0002G0023 [Candidatus Yanofskybacteria bacterium GW2011_GWE1_40_10]KKR41042.1 MAG: hypothetical protein UT75_C0002G0079 [Candidatus Yanofskybacteria bacterium GW2011_GWE2_40_11]KKT15457.1 MAG: hypothetical protein UV97_C0006G0024 [Candidatus Yanofskybacteria bacterium GW2011_GWF2_43_596]KKT53127.1 MAG: hypothetical protein UW46_C0006G0028 [Candidatus Yanofskybacteria bacterium GW2011_GWF1_44_227]OGN35523.1 MAG: hypothetical protein A2207_02165 [Candidatus Yano